MTGCCHPLQESLSFRVGATTSNSSTSPKATPSETSTPPEDDELLLPEAGFLVGQALPLTSSEMDEMLSFVQLSSDEVPSPRSHPVPELSTSTEEDELWIPEAAFLLSIPVPLEPEEMDELLSTDPLSQPLADEASVSSAASRQSGEPGLSKTEIGKEDKLPLGGEPLPPVSKHEHHVSAGVAGGLQGNRVASGKESEHHSHHQGSLSLQRGTQVLANPYPGSSAGGSIATAPYPESYASKHRQGTSVSVHSPTRLLMPCCFSGPPLHKSNVLIS